MSPCKAGWTNAYHSPLNAMGKYLGREFKYYGESQEVVSQRARCELMKPPKRPDVKTTDDTSILRTQNYRMCHLR